MKTKTRKTKLSEEEVSKLLGSTYKDPSNYAVYIESTYKEGEEKGWHNEEQIEQRIIVESIGGDLFPVVSDWGNPTKLQFVIWCLLVVVYAMGIKLYTLL